MRSSIPQLFLMVLPLFFLLSCSSKEPVPRIVKAKIPVTDADFQKLAVEAVHHECAKNSKIAPVETTWFEHGGWLANVKRLSVSGKSQEVHVFFFAPVVVVRSGEQVIDPLTVELLENGRTKAIHFSPERTSSYKDPFSTTPLKGPHLFQLTRKNVGMKEWVDKALRNTLNRVRIVKRGLEEFREKNYIVRVIEEEKNMSIFAEAKDPCSGGESFSFYFDKENMAMRDFFIMESKTSSCGR